MRSFSNCKIAAVLAHDAEFMYPYKLLLSCCVTCLTPLSGPIVSSPPHLLGWRYDFPKMGRRNKGRGAKNSLNWGGMSNRGKDHKTGAGGKCLKCK